MWGHCIRVQDFPHLVHCHLHFPHLVLLHFHLQEVCNIIWVHLPHLPQAKPGPTQRPGQHQHEVGAQFLVTFTSSVGDLERSLGPTYKPTHTASIPALRACHLRPNHQPDL